MVAKGLPAAYGISQAEDGKKLGLTSGGRRGATYANVTLHWKARNILISAWDTRAVGSSMLERVVASHSCHMPISCSL